MNERKIFRIFATLALSALVLVRCGADESTTSEISSSSPQAAGGAQVTPSTAPGVAEKLFDKSIRTDGCSFLSAGDVAEIASVDESRLTRPARSMCYFKWPDGTAMVSIIRVHKDLKRARTHYANLTRDTTAAEMQAAKERVKQRMDEKQSEGEVSARDEKAGGAILDMMPNKDISYERVPGIGNEAALDDDGVLKVRVGNVTFSVEATSNRKSDRELTLAVGKRAAANLARM